jgi:hypothetical protein
MQAAGREPKPEDPHQGQIVASSIGNRDMTRPERSPPRLERERSPPRSDRRVERFGEHREWRHDKAGGRQGCWSSPRRGARDEVSWPFLGNRSRRALTIASLGPTFVAERQHAGGTERLDNARRPSCMRGQLRWLLESADELVPQSDGWWTGASGYRATIGS